MENKLKYFSSMIFNKKTWKTVFGKHKLTIPKNGEIEDIYSFKLTKKILAEWNDLYNSQESRDIIPYTFYWHTAMEYLMHKLLPDLGMNLRYVFHIGQEAELFNEYSIDESSVYINENRLIDLVPMKKNRMMIVTEQKVNTDSGNKIYKSIDYTIVQNVPLVDMEPLEKSEYWGRTALTFMNKGFSKRQPKFSNVLTAKKRATYFCPKDLWFKFGKVSGAISVTHGYWLISRYFRGEEPFMQGMCSGNIVLKLLHQELGEKLDKYNVYFNNKLFFPQTVELRCDDTDFELYDEKENMIAFGSRVQKDKEVSKKNKSKKVIS